MRATLHNHVTYLPTWSSLFLCKLVLRLIALLHKKGSIGQLWHNLRVSLKWPLDDMKAFLSIIGSSPTSSSYVADHVWVESYHRVFVTPFLVQVPSSELFAPILLYSSANWVSCPSRPTNCGQAWILLQPRKFKWPLWFFLMSWFLSIFRL